MPNLTPFYRAAKNVVRSLPAWLIRFRPFVVYEISFTHSPDVAATLESDSRASLPCEIRWLEDASAVAALGPLASQECRDAWNGSTRRVAAVWLGDQPIACTWVATQSFDERELGIRIELAPDEAWLHAAVVDFAHRGQGVYRQLLEFVLDELRRSGLRRLLLGVTIGNEPSRRVHATQGAMEVGRITAFRTLGMAFSCCTGRIRNLPRIAQGDRAQIRFAVEP